MITQPNLALANGLAIPTLGLGVYKVPAGDTERVVSAALALGYRLIDTAALYGNERQVGKAIRSSGLPREDVFVTTKLHPATIFDARRAFFASLERLGLDYIDVYLLHWPFLRTRELWRSLEDLYDRGVVKALGVSNFNAGHLGRLIRHARVPPLINQIEFHPFLYRRDLLEFCSSLRIAVQAHSPLTHGKRLLDPTVAAIADKYAKSPAQVLLRWAVQHGAGVLPKTTNQNRLAENSHIFDFSLGSDDMQALDNLNESLHVAGLSKLAG